MLAVHADTYKFAPPMPERPEQIPGYVWIGDYVWRNGRFVWTDGYYERIASPEPRRPPPPAPHRPWIDPMVIRVGFFLLIIGCLIKAC